MQKNTLRIIVGFFTIIFLVPFAFGFSLPFLFKGQKPVACPLSDKPIDAIMEKYNNTIISEKLLGFVKENNYNNAIVKIKNGRCKYKYAVKITDSGCAIITSNTKNSKGIKISTTYKNLAFANETYDQRNSINLLIAGFKTKMPWNVRFNVISFLTSYL